MSLNLITYGDTFLDVIIGPLKPILLRGNIEVSVGQNYFKALEAMMIGGRVGNRRLNLAPTIERHGGGSAANTAFAAAKLGSKSGIITRVGGDENGVFVVDQLRKIGVDVSHVVVDNREPTGYNTILLSDDGSRASITYLGACNNLCPEDIDISYIKRAMIVHMTNLYLLPSLMGRPLTDALQKFKEAGVVLSLDPGPIPFTYSDKRIKFVIPALKLVDIFQPTIDEAKCICDLDTPNEIVDKLLSYNLKTVVLKMGKEGCLIAHNGEKRKIPAFRTESVMDTTGAGDVFAASLLTELVKGINIWDAAHFASVAAAVKLGGKGRSFYPTRGQVEELLKR